MKGNRKRSHIAAKPAHKVWLLATMIVASARPSPSTTVVAIWTPKGVFLAADSLAVENTDDVGGRKTHTVCKILTTLDCAVGFAGLAKQDDTGFDVEKIIQTACDSGGNIAERAQHFAATARTPLIRALDHMRDVHPKWYADNYLGKNVLGALFAGTTSDGKLTVVGKNFRLSQTGIIQPVQTEILPKPDSWILPLGEQDQIKAYVTSHHDDWVKPDLTAAAVRFVQLEINAVPKWVGPPISVFVIEYTGKRYWAPGYEGQCK